MKINNTNSLILTRILIMSLAFFIIQFFLNVSYAVEPDEILKNQEYELRARNISKNIRCMICQNQSIDESNAPLAKDLPILIRNKISLSRCSVIWPLMEAYGELVSNFAWVGL